MRKLLIALLLLEALSPRGVASAQTLPLDDAGQLIQGLVELAKCRPHPNGKDLVCAGGIVIPLGAITGQQVKWPPDGWVLANRVAFTDDGKPCLTSGYIDATKGLPSDLVNPYDGGTLIPDGTFPACPARSGEPSTGASLAALLWEQVIPLPKPNPYVAPGWAITGKRAYLETNGQISFLYTESTPIGPLTIDAIGHYFVDWGDGEQTGPYSVEGKPWPNGDITHDYIWSGTYDIVVTERWTASWSLAGRSGTLRELRTTGRIDDFPARQIQAVIGARS